MRVLIDLASYRQTCEQQHDHSNPAAAKRDKVLEPSCRLRTLRAFVEQAILLRLHLCHGGAYLIHPALAFKEQRLGRNRIGPPPFRYHCFRNFDPGGELRFEVVEPSLLRGIVGCEPE
jgi:hypothetical protein